MRTDVWCGCFYLWKVGFAARVRGASLAAIPRAAACMTVPLSVDGSPGFEAGDGSIVAQHALRGEPYHVAAPRPCSMVSCAAPAHTQSLYSSLPSICQALPTAARCRIWRAASAAPLCAGTRPLTQGNAPQIPVGTRFRIYATLADKEGSGRFLHTHHNWPYEVLQD
jgi:hypothetical protein